MTPKTRFNHTWPVSAAETARALQAAGIQVLYHNEGDANVDGMVQLNHRFSVQVPNTYHGAPVLSRKIGGSAKKPDNVGCHIYPDSKDWDAMVELMKQELPKFPDSDPWINGEIEPEPEIPDGPPTLILFHGMENSLKRWIELVEELIGQKAGPIIKRRLPGWTWSPHTTEIPLTDKQRHQIQEELWYTKNLEADLNWNLCIGYEELEMIPEET